MSALNDRLLTGLRALGIDPEPHPAVSALSTDVVPLWWLLLSEREPIGTCVLPGDQTIVQLFRVPAVADVVSSDLRIALTSAASYGWSIRSCEIISVADEQRIIRQPIDLQSPTAWSQMASCSERGWVRVALEHLRAQRMIRIDLFRGVIGGAIPATDPSAWENAQVLLPGMSFWLRAWIQKKAAPWVIEAPEALWNYSWSSHLDETVDQLRQALADDQRILPDVVFVQDRDLEETQLRLVRPDGRLHLGECDLPGLIQLLGEPGA